MRIGFIGTRAGMGVGQLRQFQRICYALQIDEFHCGGAAGADTQAVRFVRTARIPVVIHPCPGVILADLGDGLEWRASRSTANRHIVDETDMLVAAPRTNTEELRSGTWMTVRYARKAGKPIIMLSRGEGQ